MLNKAIQHSLKRRMRLTQLRHGTLNELAHTVAHKLAYLVRRANGQTIRRKRRIRARRQIIQRIKQRTVEIPDDCLDFHMITSALIVYIFSLAFS